MIERLRSFGALALLLIRGLRASPRLWAHEALRTLSRFGFGSLAIALAVAGATGALIVIETSAYTVTFGARDILGGMAGISIMREFGPLMMALVMAGWVGASNAAELGNLTLGGQVAALRGLGVDPNELLVAPRLWGTLGATCLLALPVDLASLGGGIFAAKVAMHIEPGLFLRAFATYVKVRDVGEGLVKIFSFGAAIALISTRAGLSVRGGARAVGRSVAQAVVQSVVAVLLLDFAVTALIGGRI